MAYIIHGVYTFLHKQMTSTFRSSKYAGVEKKLTPNYKEIQGRTCQRRGGPGSIQRTLKERTGAGANRNDVKGEVYFFLNLQGERRKKGTPN